MVTPAEREVIEAAKGLRLMENGKERGTADYAKVTLESALRLFEAVEALKDAERVWAAMIEGRGR